MPDKYPRWKYHATKPAIIVPDEAAEKKLGKDWYDSPADVQKPEVKEKG